jgi:serine/threonine-protein phosphatase 6 regulatory subunit 3
VYDLVHQILTGRVDTGLNQDLILALFRDARLMHRIVEGQKHNDAEKSVSSQLRLPSSLNQPQALNPKAFALATWVI